MRLFRPGFFSLESLRSVCCTVRPADKLSLVRQAAPEDERGCCGGEEREGNRGDRSGSEKDAVALRGRCRRRVRAVYWRTNERWPLPIKMRAVRRGAGAACVRVGEVRSALAVLELRNFTATVGH